MSVQSQAILHACVRAPAGSTAASPVPRVAAAVLHGHKRTALLHCCITKRHCCIAASRNTAVGNRRTSSAWAHPQASRSQGIYHDLGTCTKPPEYRQPLAYRSQGNQHPVYASHALHWLAVSHGATCSARGGEPAGRAPCGYLRNPQPGTRVYVCVYTLTAKCAIPCLAETFHNTPHVTWTSGAERREAAAERREVDIRDVRFGFFSGH